MLKNLKGTKIYPCNKPIQMCIVHSKKETNLSPLFACEILYNLIFIFIFFYISYSKNFLNFQSNSKLYNF